MTDEEMKLAFESIPESPGIVRWQCGKCGAIRSMVLDVGETLEQAKTRFIARHEGYCDAIKTQDTP